MGSTAPNRLADIACSARPDRIDAVRAHHCISKTHTGRKISQRNRVVKRDFVGSAANKLHEVGNWDAGR